MPISNAPFMRKFAHISALLASWSRLLNDIGCTCGWRLSAERVRPCAAVNEVDGAVLQPHWAQLARHCSGLTQRRHEEAAVDRPTIHPAPRVQRQLHRHRFACADVIVEDADPVLVLADTHSAMWKERSTLLIIKRRHVLNYMYYSQVYSALGT